MHILGCFDGNTYSMDSMGKSNAGHFGCENYWGTPPTNEDGTLLGDLMFGTNHVAVFSNDAHYGNLSNGRAYQGIIHHPYINSVSK